MNATLFAYCERLQTGAEPWNVVSNLAFAALGAYAVRCLRRSRNAATPPGAAEPRRSERHRVTLDRSLAALPFAIALGSALYHQFPSALTRSLDIFPIGLFVALALVLTLRRHFALSPRSVTAFASVWLIATLACGSRPEILGGSLLYLPTLFSLGLLASLAAARRGEKTSSGTRARALGTASILFAAALFFRTADVPLCSSFPTGTHILWHLLAAASGAPIVRLLLSHAHEPSSAGTSVSGARR